MLTDKNGKNAESLRDKKLYLLDMDGTIYNEDEIFEGTLDFLDEIERRGGQYIFITNNSSKSVNDYVDKVAKMGIRPDTRTSTHPARRLPCTSMKIIRARWSTVWEPVL